MIKNSRDEKTGTLLEKKLIPENIYRPNISPGCRNFLDIFL